MSYIQQPISRHISGDRTMAGVTTMIPQTSLDYMRIPEQQQYDSMRQAYLRHHALAPRTTQIALGMRGSTDDGHRYEMKGNLHDVRYNWDTSFGTPSVQRSLTDNIVNTINVDKVVLGRGGRGGKFRG